MRKIFIHYTIGLIALLATMSCNKDEVLTSSSAKLDYSVDTVFFDTIFTDVGSRTKQFLVYNNNDGIIRINSIYIGDGGTSDYIMNINGVSGNNQTDVEIDPGDSIYIFIQAKLPETGTDTLVVNQDIIVFEYNGNTDDVAIVSWGQDVEILSAVSVGTETWSSQKPFLIYDSLVVEDGATLTIEAGVTLYFTYNSNLIVKGNIVVNGTVDNPVRFLPDRLEYSRSTYPGQWGSIQIRESSEENYFNYAFIKNGISGLVIDKNVSDRTKIELHNSKIENMTYAGIYAEDAEVWADNCVFSNCAEYILAVMGGKHSYYHCTVANVINLSGSIRSTPGLLVTDYLLSDDSETTLDSAYFANCIIIGNKTHEIEFDPEYSESLNCKIEHSLLSWYEDYEDAEDAEYFSDEYYFDTDSTLFIDGDFNDFRLDTLSQAIGKADADIAQQFPLDLKGHDRPLGTAPDCGAYEYYYEE